MSSAQDWYRRHLGGEAGATSPPPAGPPRSSPPSPSPYYASPPAAYQPPPGYRLVPDQAQAQAPDTTMQYLASMGIGQGGGHANPWIEPPPSPVDTSRIPRGTINPANILELANFWRGGQGRKEAQHCPRCDGVLFRRFEGRREAAPLCTSCGWNGLFDQGEHAHVSA